MEVRQTFCIEMKEVRSKGLNATTECNLDMRALFIHTCREAVLVLWTKNQSMLLLYKPTRSKFSKYWTTFRNVRLSRGKVNPGERLWNTEHVRQWGIVANFSLLWECQKLRSRSHLMISRVKPRPPSFSLSPFISKQS